MSAVLLSLLCLPAGYFFIGQNIKGLVFTAGAILLAIFTGGLSALVTYPMALIDCGILAGKLNRGQAIGQWEVF